MKNKPTLLHILRTVPLSIFTGWKILLPSITFVVVFYAYHYQWSQHNETGYTPTIAAQGIVGVCYIVVWFAAALVTRVGYPANWIFLKMMPVPITRQLVVIFTEHLGLLLAWVIIPVLVLISWIGQLQAHWCDVLLACIGGNVLFGLYITIFNLYARYAQGKPDLLVRPFLVATGFSVFLLIPFFEELTNNSTQTVFSEQPLRRETVIILGCLIAWSLAFISGLIPEKPLQQYRVRPNVNQPPPVLLHYDRLSTLPPGGMSLSPFFSVISKAVCFFLVSMILLLLRSYSEIILPLIEEQEILESFLENKIISSVYHALIDLIFVSGFFLYWYFLYRGVRCLYDYGCLLRDCQMRPIHTGATMARAWIQIGVATIVCFVIFIVAEDRLTDSLGLFVFTMILSVWTLATAWDIALLSSPIQEGSKFRNLGTYELGILIIVSIFSQNQILRMEYEYRNPMPVILGVLISVVINTATMYLMWKRF